MNKDIYNKMVRSCERCQEHGPKKINEKPHPVPVPIKPFSQVRLDKKHVTPSQGGHRYIITAIDNLTKYVEVKAIKSQTSSEIALFLYEEIITRHRCIFILITDNDGGPMISDLVNTVCNKKFGIRHKPISPYHSRSQGLVERLNRTLDSCLKKRSESEKKNWNQYLLATAFAYRSIKQETTGQSPFYLLYGYEPQTYFDNTLRPIDIKEPSFELQLRIRTTIQIQHLNNRQFVNILVGKNIDSVVKDKFSSSPLGGIQIKGRAENSIKQERSKQTKLKQSIASYLHAKTRIEVHLKTRHEKLNKLIIPTLKEDLAIIRRKHSDINKYNTAKSKYINQFFTHKHEAAAFTKKHLRNI